MHKKWTGKEVKRFRESLEITQPALARLLHMEDCGTISRWEQEKFNPSPIYCSILSELADKCGYDKANPKKVSLTEG